MKKLLLIHGPNLNLLGKRDSQHYGTQSLADLEAKCTEKAKELGFELVAFQSNHEGELIDFIQANKASGILINPGALSHYSYALHDALLDTQLPCIEVHLSDISNRESWRKKSVTAPACLTQISGKGAEGYLEALELFTRPINAVIGNPLEKSWSPKLHNSAYKELGIKAVLVKMENENIQVLVDRIRHQNIALTAVTMPHKENIISLLDEVDPLAKEIGAVNTVINKDGQLYGYNTDIIGIEAALLDLDLKGKKVLIIGAGGAAKAVAHVLKAKGSEIFILNRTPHKAAALAQKYGAKVVDKIPKNIDHIINATPQEMDCTFDLNYHRNQRGLKMFVIQGLEQARLWTGKSLDPVKYLNELK